MTKKIILLMLFIVSALCITAQDVNISFTGSDESGNNADIDSIIITNTRTNVSDTLSGVTEFVLKNVVTSISEIQQPIESIQVIPQGDSEYKLSFNSSNSGFTSVNVYSLDGRTISSYNNYLPSGSNAFQLTLPQGIFIVKVIGIGYSYSSKVLNQHANGSTSAIEYIGSTNQSQEQDQSRKNILKSGVIEETRLGDNMLYRAKDENGNIAIVVQKVSVSKNINFNFIVCKDANGINYPTVRIGSQVWMAQNLASTKYNDGTDIPYIMDNAAWAGATTGGYCYMNNNAFQGYFLGGLYNMLAVETNKLAPLGWRIPYSSEFETLSGTSNGNSGSIIGGSLMSTIPNSWTSPYSGATNETGFSAIASGYRYKDGSFNESNHPLGSRFICWTSTKGAYRLMVILDNNGGFDVDYWSNDPVFFFDATYSGVSVRCVKNVSIADLITTTPVTITARTAISGGNVSSDGGATITSRGICWSTSPLPTIQSTKTVETGTLGEFTSAMTGLAPGTKYYVRAYATNAVGTNYGEIVSFTTLTDVPTLTTTTISNISATAATGGGEVTSNGGLNLTAKGICWSTTPAPTTALNTKTTESVAIGSFSSSMTGLIPNTTYYVRSYATNSVGTAYGQEISFKTITTIPTLSTSAITNLKATTATSGGNVSSDGGATVTERGVCWSTTTAPTTALSTKTTESGATGTFSSLISSLTPTTTYYVRAYATNSAGTAYGQEFSFTTPVAPIPNSDADGNVYTTVTIGTQTWIVENLRTTKYNDGTPIVNSTEWGTTSEGAYCWFNNDIYNKDSYGALYNWHAVNSGKLAPEGYRIATQTDWDILVAYLNQQEAGAAGKALKDIVENSFWDILSYPATNSSGYTALGSGYRDATGFYGNSTLARWWSATESFDEPSFAYLFSVYYQSDAVDTWADDKQSGFSVRCIKIEE